jgi:hypothetical protein
MATVVENCVEKAFFLLLLHPALFDEPFFGAYPNRVVHEVATERLVSPE